MRETIAVADLIPGDIIVPQGWSVEGYPHGVPGLPGTIVALDKGGAVPILIRHHFSDSETQVTVLRNLYQDSLRLM